MSGDGFLEVNGLRLHYRDWGGSGHPVLLLHGLASTCRIWDMVAPRLARSFRVLGLDLRGHGLSQQPDEGYDLPTVAGDVLAALEALGMEGAVLVGHSWGAHVVLECALRRPFPALVLVDGGFLELSSWLPWEEVWRELAPPRLDGLTLDAFLAQGRLYYASFWSPEVEEVARSLVEVQGDGTIRPRLRRENHRRVLQGLYEQRPSQLYPHVRCPVLLVAAREEPRRERERRWLLLKEEGVRQAQRLLPRARVLWLEDTVHDVPLQRPEELAVAIESFLRGVLSPIDPGRG